MKLVLFVLIDKKKKKSEVGVRFRLVKKVFLGLG